MPTLASEHRSKLERVIIEARDVAETGARAALEALAVHHHEPYPHMKPPERKLRNHLRARARQLGDQQDRGGRQAIDHLVGECAYEHWHRMLFARFLAENNLLIEPQENMAISLAEAEELAKEEGVDVWFFASRCAQQMLPQIFRPDDPLLQVPFATEHILKLEQLLASLPIAVFTTSDALGWVYQFWQSKKKDEVNKSEVKIGADEISAVTQLFTESYMVEFLLHNTLGAWWAGKTLTAEVAASARNEDELRAKLALPGVDWDYLRFVRGEDGKSGPWKPAAGAFDDWPKTAAGIKVLDPCCGSGHFLVAALHHLVPIRMAEEGLSATAAIDAVLSDNLHGLEIDERCCQIAAFALALAAWTYPHAGGYRPLADLHVACTGIAPQASKDQWLKLAEKAAAKGQMPAKRDLFGKEDSLLSSKIASGLESLYDLFALAPTLGSLVDPRHISQNLYQVGYESLVPLLAEIFKVETDDETRERAIAAAGMVKAADLLSGDYTLVLTNVPYLGRGKQGDALRDYLETHFNTGKADLATAFMLRCRQFCATSGNNGGSVALVTPQNWQFLTTYTKFRRDLIQHHEINLVARLGPGAFETISGHVVNVTLLALSASSPAADHLMAGIDVSDAKQPHEKALLLSGVRTSDVGLVRQADQLKNPDARVTLDVAPDLPLLSETAESLVGIQTGDYPRFVRLFWEIPRRVQDWEFYSRPAKSGLAHSEVILWESGCGALLAYVHEKLGVGSEGAWLRGEPCWGKRGVAVQLLGTLDASLYEGQKYDQTVAVLKPRDEQDLLPLLAYCSSPSFAAAVRRIDRKMNLTNSTLAKVPFDLQGWKQLAAKKYPDGLPEPESNDPTQWLFHGLPSESTSTLQVATARLLGYRWPAELDENVRLSKRARTLVKQCDAFATLADDDGIVCIPSVRGEEPAAERLFTLLTACDIEPQISLDEWLRNIFFEEHCKLFHDRPFVWHIWDGRKRDGFHALINYHKLCEGGGMGRKRLESLTYSYLGEWITRQKDGVSRDEAGAEDRLAAALELQKRLELILAGEPPFDIFVRWKPLAEQPIGWEPDINDGVRMNIRPFLASDLPGGKKGAGILRAKPNVKWAKDRGKEPDRPKAEYPWFWNWDEETPDFMGTGKEPDGNRHNDCHYNNRAKQAAREGTR